MSEEDPGPQLDVARATHGSIPHAKSGIPNARVKRERSSPGVERVPVPGVKQLTPDLEAYGFCKLKHLHDTDILVVIPKSPQVRNSRPTAQAELDTFGTGSLERARIE